MADGTIDIPSARLPRAGAAAIVPAHGRLAAEAATGPSLTGIPVLSRPHRGARSHERDRTITRAALVGGDVAALALGAGLVEPFSPTGALMLETLGLLSAAIVILLWSAGLYPGYGVYLHELMRRRIVAFSKAGALAVPGAFLLGGWQAVLVVSAFLALSLLLQPILRSLIRDALRRTGHWGVQVGIVADDAQSEALRQFLSEHWQLGLRCQASGCRVDADTLLVAAGSLDADGIERARGRTKELILLGALPGAGTARGLRPSDLQGEIGLRVRLAAPTPASPGPAGRTFDCAVAAVLLLALTPFLLTAAALIYLVDPGPVLYRQPREGLGGRSFGILKLRTMYRDADRRLETLLATDAAARAEWARYFKLRNDPRILPVVGGALRLSSVDELPQLLNVIRGEMRLVGPRPFPDYHLAAMSPAFRARRAAIVPGVTGLWQASGRSTADVARQQALDGFYIDNRSVWLDLHILCLTPAAVLCSRGAY